MALKQYKPTSPGQRQLVTVSRSELFKGKPNKSLSKGLTKTGGRNNTGRVTAFHRGGGHKRKYRFIDFKRKKINIFANVKTIEYDPNRSSFIALIEYEDGEKNYIIAPQKLKVGDKVISGSNSDIITGNALPLSSIPVGTLVHNVELKPGKGGQLARAAGSYVQLIGRDHSKSIIRLTSGEVRLVLSTCFATIGSVSNPDNQNTSESKAGRNRWLGKRPHVRGVAMNPIDHPHGGGEGKTSGGRHPVTPWGKPTKGKRTRSNKKTDKMIIRRRKS
tara:strand:+ start:733 stop:1557 length:825 start_codon:yes stop_codon:yes gene_type:complete